MMQFKALQYSNTYTKEVSFKDTHMIWTKGHIGKL